MSQQLRHNRLWRRDMQVIESHLNAICPFQSNAMDHNVANPHPTFQYHIHGDDSNGAFQREEGLIFQYLLHYKGDKRLIWSSLFGLMEDEFGFICFVVQVGGTEFDDWSNIISVTVNGEEQCWEVLKGKKQKRVIYILLALHGV